MPSLTMFRGFALIACLVSACGGKVSPTRQGPDGGALADCANSSSAFPSDVSVALAYCRGGPPAAGLLAVVQSSDPVDLLGTSPTWGLAFVDQASGIEYRGAIGAASGSVAAFPALGNGFSCRRPVDPASSSAILVPDAVRRLNGLAVYPGKDTRIVFRATGECPPLADVAGVMVSFRVSVGSGYTWWKAHYGLAGDFLRICGPCASDVCTSCSAQ